MRHVVELSLTPDLLNKKMLVQPTHNGAGNGEWNQKELIEAILTLDDEQFTYFWTYVQEKKDTSKLFSQSRETFSLTLVQYYLYLLKTVDQGLGSENRLLSYETMQILGRALTKITTEGKN